MLHDISDALPHKVHLTLPSHWAKRRLRVPKGVVVHHADVPKHERAHVGPVPVTNALRTLCDCVAAHVSPEFIEAGIRQARARGLISKQDVSKIRKSERAA